MTSIDSTNIKPNQVPSSPAPVLLAASHSYLMLPGDTGLSADVAGSLQSSSANTALPTRVNPRPWNGSSALHSVCQLSHPTPEAGVTGEDRLSTLASLLTKLSDMIMKLTEALKAAQAGSTTPTNTPATTPTGSSTTPSSTTPSSTTPSSNTPATGTTNPSTSESDAEEGPDTAAAKLPFADKERSVLKPDSNKKVSEVELRRGVVVFQLYQKDEKLADEFQTAYDSAHNSGQTSTNAVKSALLQLVGEKKLTKAEANWVYSLSARAAQFEGSESALSTTTTGTHGLELNAAIQLSERTLAGIQSGAIAVKPLSIS